MTTPVPVAELLVSCAGKMYPVPLSADEKLESVLEFLGDVIHFPQEYSKLIFRGVVLNLNSSPSDYQMPLKAKVMLVGSSKAEVEQLRSMRPDPLVKGFDEEKRDELRRQLRALEAGNEIWGGSKMDSTYNFGRFEALFKYNQPTPFEAEKVLKRLACDPGIVKIMKERKWHVGLLCEMDPIETDQRRAMQGEDGCLLGWNRNFGEVICLRLRTDDARGFRPYKQLINTLLHELTHNVIGPHNADFWKLFSELKKEYLEFHNFYSRNGKTVGSGPPAHHLGALSADEIRRMLADLDPSASSPPPPPQKLGGVTLPDPGSIRAKRLRAFEVTPRGKEGVGGLCCPHDHQESEKGGDEVIDLMSESEGKDEEVLEEPEKGSERGTSPQVELPSPTPPPLCSTNDVEGDGKGKGKEKVQEKLEEVGVDLSAVGLDGASQWTDRFRKLVKKIDDKQKSLLLKLIENPLRTPGEEKFRVLKSSNQKVSDFLRFSSFDGCSYGRLCLLSLGWEEEEGGWRLREGRMDWAKLYMGIEIVRGEM